MDNEKDIVARLRLYSQRHKETKSTVLGLLLSDSADEIERLRKERDEARRLAETISRDVSMLSTRPATIIKLSDLVDLINEWGDAARSILDEREKNNV